MYSYARYRSDLKKVWKPVGKSGGAFLKSLQKLDPSSYAEPCLHMCGWFILFLFALVFLTGRKLINL